MAVPELEHNIPRWGLANLSSESVRIMPRAWSDRNKGFRMDMDMLPDGGACTITIATPPKLRVLAERVLAHAYDGQYAKAVRCAPPAATLPENLTDEDVLSGLSRLLKRHDLSLDEMWILNVTMERFHAMKHALASVRGAVDDALGK